MSKFIDRFTPEELEIIKRELALDKHQVNISKPVVLADTKTALRAISEEYLDVSKIPNNNKELWIDNNLNAITVLCDNATLNYVQDYNKNIRRTPNVPYMLEAKYRKLAKEIVSLMLSTIQTCSDKKVGENCDNQT